MKTNKLKWHKEIKAWADGAEIERNYLYHETEKWEAVSVSQPIDWGSSSYEYRIKPQPKEKKYLYVFHNIDKGTYEIGEKPHPQMNYRPIIGKIEVLDYD